MNYKVQHINNKKKIHGGMNPKYLTIHSTANPRSTAQNERDNLNRVNNTSSTGFHIAVDDKQAIECIPLNKVAYHAGDGAYGTGNSKFIGIEMCESGNRERTINNTIQLAAKMLKDRNWGIDRLKRYYDWGGKNCPRILNYNNWEGWMLFKEEVGELLNNKDEKQYWGEKHFKNLNDKGYKVHDRRFNDYMTRAEVIALVDRITDEARD